MFGERCGFSLTTVPVKIVLPRTFLKDWSLVKQLVEGYSAMFTIE